MLRRVIFVFMIAYGFGATYADVRDCDENGVLLPTVGSLNAGVSQYVSVPPVFEMILNQILPLQLQDSKGLCYCDVQERTTPRIYEQLLESSDEMDEELAGLLRTFGSPDYLVQAKIVDFSYIPRRPGSALLDGRVSVQIWFYVWNLRTETPMLIYSTLCNYSNEISASNSAIKAYNGIYDEGYINGLRSLAYGVLGVTVAHTSTYINIANSKMALS